MQRDKAEQIEKARLRHKHALAQLQLEEVRSSDFQNTCQEQINKVEPCYFTITGAKKIVCYTSLYRGLLDKGCTVSQTRLS